MTCQKSNDSGDMSKESRWIIIDRGSLPERTLHIDYMCTKCMRESLLPVTGIVLAQSGQSLVFDIGPHATPAQIRCPHCRSSLVLE